MKRFASNPEIVTPIGIAIDASDRVFVLESHTHSPPPDYKGPKSDIVKVFEDGDGDGTPEKRWNFADGIDAGMNLAFSKDGTLYVCAAKEVWAFSDTDRDFVADSRKRILSVESENNYPHNCQMGIAISDDGWLYISRGNTGGRAYTVHGTDGSSISGFGDGGSVYRCRPDGSELEEFAAGFWNSMDLKFDMKGLLLLVDNDPDARGPNRLVQVVQDGDYGYKSIFGGGGNHPFQGWDGKLPGTLPYAAAIGEAPCGIIDTDRTALPVAYHDNYLVTVWNENAIYRYVPSQQGSSISARAELWMQGDQNFRPIAMEADSRGNLYITDWVLVNYPVHGRGAIWRVSPKTGVNTMKPRGYFDTGDSDPGTEAFEALIDTNDPRDLGRLESALAGDDPFLQHAAVVALSRSEFQTALPGLAKSENGKIRLGALLALRKSGASDVDEALRGFLQDPDEEVRIAALMWIGEEGRVELKGDIGKAIAFGNVSTRLFEAWLAAHETLDPAFIRARESRKGAAGHIRRRLDPAIVERVAKNNTEPEKVRALAIVRLQNVDAPDAHDFLVELAKSGSPVLQKEAVRSLSLTAKQSNRALFLEVASDRTIDSEVRAEALLALSRETMDEPAALLPLLDDPDEAVRIEAARTLRRYALQPNVKTGFKSRLDSLTDRNGAVAELLESPLSIAGTAESKLSRRPTTLDEWSAALAKGGDPVAGERVFFSARTICTTCHLIDGRGRRIGPELSNIGQSLSREQIIRSIIKPSDSFAPQYQAWFVDLNDGGYYQGLQLDHKARGDIELFTTEGITRHFDGPNIAGYGVLPNSLMPAGLEMTMTVQEMRDLVAFLASLD